MSFRNLHERNFSADSLSAYTLATLTRFDIYSQVALLFPVFYSVLLASIIEEGSLGDNKPAACVYGPDFLW